VNTAYHSESSFQDAGFKKSFFIAPSLSYKVNDRLSFLINTEFIAAEGTNPVMLFLNRSNPLQYENLEDLNYNSELSLTSNDLSIKNPRYNLQAQMLYKLSDKWTSQTAIARGSAASNGYYSYLWDGWLDKGEFSLYISDQNAKTITTDIQQNFIGDFNVGGLRNRMVIGFDYFHRHLTDNSTGYLWLHDVTPQGEINYVDPYTGDTLAPRYLSRQSVDAQLASFERSNSNTKDAAYSAYISDVINISPQLLVMASLRVDYFDTEGDITTDEDDYHQTALSPKFGLLYQPIPDKLSVFANYMNGFKNVAPMQVADVGGDNPRTKTFEPEHANQLEFGIKTNLFSDKLISTLSYYDINLTNVVISDPENVNNSTQGGEVESKGFEIDIIAHPVSGLNLIAGYSYNDSKILEGEADGIWFQEGKRPVFSGPQNLFNAWATYRFTSGVLQGFGLGLGANYASELSVLDSDVTGKFTLPSYTVLNTSLFYDTHDFRITLNVNNVTDEEYYKGYSTINPQKPRNVSASFTYRF
jgi:iron complex outermembrane receptor protein